MECNECDLAKAKLAVYLAEADLMFVQRNIAVQERDAAFAAGARAYREIALATLAGREIRLAGRDPQFGLETLECWREIEALPLPEPERK